MRQILPTADAYNSLFKLALISGIGSTLIIDDGTGIWPFLTALMGLGMLALKIKRGDSLPKPIRFATVSLAATGTLIGTVSFCIETLHQNPPSYDIYFTLALFPAIGIAIYRNLVHPDTFFAGVLIASFGAFGIAAYQHYAQGIVRVSGFMNPIPFGDLCVLLAITSIIRATGIWKTRPGYSALLIVATIAAAYSSLLSGSKGGWIALALGVVVGIWRFLKILNTTPIARGTILASLLIATTYLAPDHVSSRIDSGIKGGITWFKTGNVTEGSVSARLEMWTHALMAFQQSPWIGLSQQELEDLRIEGVERGFLQPQILSLPKTADNEFLGALSTRGIFGLIVSILSFIVPIFIFRSFRNANDPLIRDLSLVGQIMPLIFIEFGLSVSIWGTSAFRLVYISWIVMLIALIAVRLVTTDRVQFSDKSVLDFSNQTRSRHR